MTRLWCLGQEGEVRGGSGAPPGSVFGLPFSQLSLAVVSQAVSRGQCISLFQTWGRSGP